MSELVKRLRARVVGYEFNDNLSDDAADRIEALEAENARLLNVWEEVRLQRDQLLAHIKSGADLPEWAKKWLAQP